jgi:preprotein translocase subunit SecF
MPPEYIRRSVYDTRSEIYSVGLVLYELLIKRRWINELNTDKVVSTLMQSNFQIPIQLDEFTPNKYYEIIATATSYHTDHRYQTPGQMREALQQAEVEEDSFVSPNVIHEPQQKSVLKDPLLVSLIVLMLIVVILFAAIIYTRYSS